eukprot:SAG11_NODE_1044_length_6049_cov_4.050084_1_plen_88_part_00
MLRFIDQIESLFFRQVLTTHQGTLSTELGVPQFGPRCGLLVRVANDRKAITLADRARGFPQFGPRRGLLVSDHLVDRARGLPQFGPG